MKRNVLVFPCGSEIGLEIYHSVRYSTYFHLIGASSIDDHGKYVYEDYIGDLPYITDESLIPTLQEIVRNRNIEIIYPTMDIAIAVLKKHENEIGCKVVGSPKETSRICLSKELTYKALKDIVPIQTVYSYEEISESVFPVFVKPKIGYGGNGTQVLHNMEELHCVENPEDKLFLEYLPGEEYTVDCFTDKDRNLLYSAARKRGRIKSGISVNTYFVEQQEEFREYIERINKAIQFRGPWFAQFKRGKTGKLYLMEIADRLGGSSSLSRGVGVNFSQLALFDIIGYPVELLYNDYSLVLDRALENKFAINIEYKTVYLDYDDCLILDKKMVNTDLVKYIIQCRNKSIKVILLTKHVGDLYGELKSFGIKDLFDEIILISQADHKAKYITDNSAIFIDDSFKERKEVRTEKGIYVFSPDMIETLID